MAGDTFGDAPERERGSVSEELGNAQDVVYRLQGTVGSLLAVLVGPEPACEATTPPETLRDRAVALCNGLASLEADLSRVVTAIGGC